MLVNILWLTGYLQHLIPVQVPGYFQYAKKGGKINILRQLGIILVCQGFILKVFASSSKRNNDETRWGLAVTSSGEAKPALTDCK